MSTAMRNRERGTALVISLIMLTLITLLVMTALNLASSNFRAVSNTQFRDEAVAAANVAIQQVIGSNFIELEEAQDLEIDLDNNDPTRPDYVVTVARPTCIYADVAEAADPSSLSLPVTMTASSTWNTVWDLDATVAPGGNAGGASVRVHSGVRMLLTQAQRDDHCP